MAAIYENHPMNNCSAQANEDTNVYENFGDKKKPGQKPKIVSKPNKPNKPPKPKRYKYLVGLDIGQSSMGYAIAPADHPREIASPKNWAASYGYTALKAPSIWANTDGVEIGFNGYDTFCNKYGSEYETDDVALGVKFARVTKDSQKEPIRIKVFNETLTELFDVALRGVRDTYGVHVDKPDIKLILGTHQHKTKPKDKKTTVSKETQQLIEQWNPENKIVEKIDAAFIYCRLNTTEKHVPKRILVINAGGSNIQLASYESSDDTKYIRASDGTGFGANRINKYFIGFISHLFEKGFVEHCKEKFPVAWLELMNSFEQCKKGATPESTTSYNLSLSSVLGSTFKAFHGEDIAEYLKGKDLSVTRDWKLRLSNRVMKVFYTNTMTEIERKITEMKTIMSCKPTKIFIVGGFSESEYMHQTVQRLFPEVKIIRPENPDICALKGSLFAEEGRIVIVNK